MFDYEQPPTEEKAPTDYTGLIFAAILAPIFLFFIYMGKAEMGLTVFIVLGMMMFAVKLRWRLRKYVWFWATIVLILALHVPLFFILQWPDTKVPTIAYSLPMGIVDFLLIMGAVGLAERIFLKNPPPDEEA
ncbi:MAG: hypothetical protein ACLQGT_11890 [Terracidiphilus sp.]